MWISVRIRNVRELSGWLENLCYATRKMTVCLNFFAWHLQNSIFPICCARATNDHTIIFHLPNSAVAFYQPNLEKWNRIKISDNLNTLDADRHISYRTQQQRSPGECVKKVRDKICKCDNIDERSEIDRQNIAIQNGSNKLSEITNKNSIFEML